MVLELRLKWLFENFYKIIYFLFVCIIIDIIFVFKFDIMAQRKYTLLEVYLLATAFNKSPQTINRWINNNDDRLTSEKAKSALLKKK